MKPCPYCAELIQQDAIVCKHCRRDIAPIAIVGKGLQEAGGGITRIAMGILAFVLLLAWFRGSVPTVTPPRVEPKQVGATRAEVVFDAAPPSGADAAPTIRSKCADEWPTDFSMRAYCEDQQRKGLSALHERVMLAGDYLTIRQKCAREWTQDFTMRDYCETTQLKALAQLAK